MGDKQSKNISNDGKPVNIQKQISIQVDPKTGKLIGVPEEWAKHMKINNIDQTKLVQTKNMPEVVKATELPKPILDLINAPQISKPFNFQR